jgi:predicted transcriptional regulator
MSKAEVTVDAEDNILKASHIMLHEDAYLLPVMEGESLIGVVRMGDLFHHITSAVLKM